MQLETVVFIQKTAKNQRRLLGTPPPDPLSSGRWGPQRIRIHPQISVKGALNPNFLNLTTNREKYWL